jgi:hypothetical protein
MLLTAANARAATYDPKLDYLPGDVVTAADGNRYEAIAKAIGKAPATDDGSFWRLTEVVKPTILDVPGRFKTIEQAWAFAEASQIRDGANVLLEVAAGNYQIAKALELNHAAGDRITLRGGGKQPEDTVLEFVSADGVIVSNGYRLVLENISLEATAKKPGTGLRLTAGSLVNAKACRFLDFATGCHVDGNATLIAESCIVESPRGVTGFEVTSSGHANLTRCVAKAGAKNGPNNQGFIASDCSSMHCIDCRAEGWSNGFRGFTSSSIILQNCIGIGNEFGVSVWWSSSLRASDCVFQRNKHAGIGVYSATAGAIQGCQISDSDKGVLVSGPAVAGFVLRASTIKKCRVGLEAINGAYVDLKTEPRFDQVGKSFSVQGVLTLQEAFLGTH